MLIYISEVKEEKKGKDVARTERKSVLPPWLDSSATIRLRSQY